MKFQADLHIHSCLSPCGDLEMSPAAIARQAREAGLNLIALTDHNCALNTPAFAAACRREGLHAFYGLEATSAEEAHCLCLFETPETAMEMAALVYESLPPLPNRPEKMGDQVYVDEEDNILGEVENYLNAGGCLYDISKLKEMTEERGGLFIPAHVDRAAFSLASQLGFIPDEAFTALEVTQANPNLDTRGLPLVCHSDAHYLDDIGKRRICFSLEWPEKKTLTIAALKGVIPQPRGVTCRFTPRG